MSKHRLWSACLALVVLSAGAAGCTALVEDTGTAGGVYLRGRSAESLVQGDLSVLAALTRAVLADMGVTVGTREADVNDLDVVIRGTGPDGRSVHVELEEDADGNTRVRASVRTNAVEWDPEYARITVERIVERLSRESGSSIRIPAGTARYSSRPPALRGAIPPHELPAETRWVPTLPAPEAGAPPL